MTACAWAACKADATAIVGEWWFCDRHARQHEQIEAGDDPDGEDLPDDLLPPEASGHGTEARARQHHRDGEQPCGPCAAAAARAKVDREKARMTTPTPIGIGLLLEQASAHSNPKVKRLGDKIEGLLSDLRALIKASEADEQVRQEVARLERQLAEAKAKLRGGKVAAVRPISDGTANGRTTPMECRKCGKVCAGGQGRAAHERVCQAQAVAAS
jgi:multidrug efflux pump subunit AcrA (membrane-fusion protein)